jgi:hypothetical protein
MDQFASPDEAVGVATSAFLALVGYNRDGAESDCLLSRLRFTDAVGNVWAMGCRMETETQKKCCSKKTACLVSDPVTDTSFTAMPCHRCPPGHSYEDAEGRHYRPVKGTAAPANKCEKRSTNDYAQLYYATGHIAASRTHLIHGGRRMQHTARLDRALTNFRPHGMAPSLD